MSTASSSCDSFSGRRLLDILGGSGETFPEFKFEIFQLVPEIRGLFRK